MSAVKLPLCITFSALFFFPNQVSVLHSSESGEHAGHMIAPPQYMQVVRHPSMIDDLYPSHSSGEMKHNMDAEFNLPDPLRK